MWTCIYLCACLYFALSIIGRNQIEIVVSSERLLAYCSVVSCVHISNPVELCQEVYQPVKLGCILSFQYPEAAPCYLRT